MRIQQLVPRTVLPTLLTLAIGIAAEARAQVLPGSQAPGGDGAPRALEVGARVGWDNSGNAPVVGGLVRVPIDPWKRLDFMPNAELTFLDGLTERQLSLDGALFLDGARSFYVGAGAAFRNTRFLDGDGALLPERETRTGYSLFAGLHGTSGIGPFGAQFEARWVFVEDLRPQTLSLGIIYAIPLQF